MEKTFTGIMVCNLLLFVKINVQELQDEKRN